MGLMLLEKRICKKIIRFCGGRYDKLMKELGGRDMLDLALV